MMKFTFGMHQPRLIAVCLTLFLFLGFGLSSQAQVRTVKGTVTTD